MIITRKSKTDNSGFSLIELIVVVLIMGILTVSLSPTIMKWLDKSRIAVDRNSLESVKDAASFAYTNPDIFAAAADKEIKITITHYADTTKIEADASIKTTDGRSFEKVFEENAGATIDDFVFKKVHDATLIYKNGVLQTEGTVIPEEFSNDL